LALGKKCNLNSTNLKRLSTVTYNKLPELLEKKVQKKEDKFLKNRKGKYRFVKRRKTTDTGHRSDSSESTPSVQRANINERVARLLTAVTKLERDNIIIDMEEENIHMEEDNIRTYSKRPYQSVKKLETTDADSSESAPSAVVQRANINERVARLLSTVTKSERDNIDIEADNIDMEEDNIDMEEDNIDSKQSTWSSGWSDSISSSERVVDIDRVARLLEDISKLEGDNIGMEEDNTEMEEDNIGTYRKKPYQSVKRPETTDTEQIIDSSDSVTSAVVQRANFNERVVRMLTTLPKFEGDDIETEEDNIGTYSKRPYQSVKRPETTDTDSSGSNMERVSRWVAHVHKDQGDNIQMKEGNILKSRKRKYRCVKRPEIKDTEQSSDPSESTSSSVNGQELNDAMERVARWIMTTPKFEGENMSGDEDMPRCAYLCMNCIIL
jgi:hypothetical protein